MQWRRPWLSVELRLSLSVGHNLTLIHSRKRLATVIQLFFHVLLNFLVLRHKLVDHDLARYQNTRLAAKKFQCDFLGACCILNTPQFLLLEKLHGAYIGIFIWSWWVGLVIINYSDNWE